MTATLLLLGGLAASASDTTPTLEQGFAHPPVTARLRSYWWWLNGNVTKASITRDLEEMAAKGFGGALICDAGGAEQDGNDRVPHGPDFGSDAWRELYKHALREADRLGLQMSLNIQSGWNLGGPMIQAEDGPKRLVWSETRVKGPAKIEQPLPKPRHKPELYRDVIVVAYPTKHAASPVASLVTSTASSAQPENPAQNASDGRNETFWVSRGVQQGSGPTAERPEWLQLTLPEPTAIVGVAVTGRPGYGPREAELQASDDGKKFRSVKKFTAPKDGPATVRFDATTAKHFRLVVRSAFDPRFPDRPRNVQIAEMQLLGKDRSWPDHGNARPPLAMWEYKALHKVYGRSAPDCTPLVLEAPGRPGEEDTLSTSVIDISERCDQDGVVRWDVPAGDWDVLRFGYTLNDHSRVSTCSDGWNGFALDPLDAKVFRGYWDQVVSPLLDDAGPLAGRALKYLHTDSWEVENINWTPAFRGEFKNRRGYDLLPFLPVIAGRLVDSREVSNRFLLDFRKTVGDLAYDHHLRPFAELAHHRGLQFHPESGGPHAVPIDAQRCLGLNDAPMSEFWARSWRHRVADTDRFFVKQPASAAHAYGRRLVLAEGFTTIGPHWQETLWDNLKPSFDQAACEGLNLLVWHAFTCSPAEMGVPGQEYFAGTHFNPNSTWWSRSGPFLAYLNRCQFLLQQGLFVADACYYYGDHVPNFSQLKRSDPASVLPGYDYDVIPEDVILTRMTVKDGRLVLPDGMSYRVLVLPELPGVSLPVLKKLKELVTAGATVIGPKPQHATGLTGFPQCDDEVKRLADELWADCDGQKVTEHRVGSGRIINGKTARDVFADDGLKPDFEFTGGDAETVLDYIHRRDGEAEIYFVANRSARPEEVACTFRVTGKRPEFWDAVSGTHRPASVWTQAAGRTTVPLEFTPYGSLFVIFRSVGGVLRNPQSVGAALRDSSAARTNFPKYTPLHELAGPWTVYFDPKLAGPGSVEFPTLETWTARPEPGVKFYSGTATYRSTFDLPDAARQARQPLFLDLGTVKQLAEVRLNGKNLGILWASPFRVEITDALRPTGNVLEIDIVNFWPNRIIGDQSLPPEKRLTRTNIRKLTRDTPLVASGLLGPVTIQTAAE